MKTTIFLLCLLIAPGAFAASPAYSNFNSNDFTTNTVVGGQISIRVNTNRFLTTNSSVAQFWGTNSADGTITNVNFGYGVVADYSSFNTNEVIHFGPLTNGGATGFRFQPFSFHGVGFNIDSKGDGTAFGTDVNNSSNWFQIGRTRQVPIAEVTSNDWVFFGTNVTFKRRITNEVLQATSPLFTDGGRALTTAGTLPTMEYTTTDPTTDGVFPYDLTRGAIAYKRDGTGSIFSWDTVGQVWR